MPKIVSITPKGMWQDFHKLEIRFEDGDFGTAFAKSENPSYKVGDDVQYTKNEKGTIKIASANAGVSFGSKPSYNNAGGDDRNKSIIRQVALKAAVEMSAAYVAQGSAIPTEKLFELAEKFNAWMLNEQKGASHGEHFAGRTTEEALPF